MPLPDPSPPFFSLLPSLAWVHCLAWPGFQVCGINVGDRVVPLEPCQGTWRQRGTFPAAAWHVVPKDLPLDTAATIVIK